jgi:hypothetical protein
MKYRDEAVASVERWAGFAADPRFGLWAAVERSFGILAGSDGQAWFGLTWDAALKRIGTTSSLAARRRHVLEA